MDFAYTSLGETRAQFTKRMKKVERHMNSDALARKDVAVVSWALRKSLLGRCELVIARKGEMFLNYGDRSRTGTFM